MATGPIPNVCETGRSEGYATTTESVWTMFCMGTSTTVTTVIVPAASSTITRCVCVPMPACAIGWSRSSVETVSPVGICAATSEASPGRTRGTAARAAASAASVSGSAGTTTTSDPASPDTTRSRSRVSGST